MSTKKINDNKFNGSKVYRGNGVQTPTFKKPVPMPTIKPAKTEPKK